VERITLLSTGGRSLEVLVPVGHRERTRGLRGREPTPMLFTHARSIHTFGMRAPIVVAFLDRDLRVIGVTTVPPRRLTWSPHARHVLEAPRGTDVRPGDRLERLSLARPSGTGCRPGRGT
jgi:uncharacterized membrane protein (UPF0127 family)